MNGLDFIFENGRAYALREGKVIEAADSIEDLEERLARSTCPNCGGSVSSNDEVCPHCGEPLTDVEDNAEKEKESKTATHVSTPNGLKGKILGRNDGLWGEEVTVRFENGRIAHLRVSDKTKFSSERTASASSPLEDLRKRIEASYGQDRDSLNQRLEELSEIRQEAGRIASSGTSYADEVVLDDLAVTATAESSQVKQALELVNERTAQAYRPPSPSFQMQAAAPQHSMGGGDASWLDHTVGQVVAEAEGRDFEQVLNEEPELFISDLSDGAVADARATRDMAVSHIRARTAGIDREQASEYERVFVDRAEQARKVAHSQRKQETHKEAATKEDKYKDLPDDILFT